MKKTIISISWPLMFSLILAVFCFSCTGGSADSKQSESTEETIDPENLEAVANQPLKMNKEYPHIPLSEKGITVVNENGWAESEMNFHIDYCQQMLVNLEESASPLVFCECFLSKIQYYYKPIHFKEAYEDQTLWNQVCLAKAKLAKQNQ